MKFSELKKGMLLCHYGWPPHKPIVDLVYIRQIDIDRVVVTKFVTHLYEKQIAAATANVTRHRWDTYRTWYELRLATYEDAKIFIKNMFEPI